MTTYRTNQFKSGLKILVDGDPCTIVSNECVKPGKGQAFNRVKIRNLKTGRTIEKTYKSGESVDSADVLEREMNFLYQDGAQWIFMDPKDYEQIAVSEKAMGQSGQWLKEQALCQITLWNGEPLLVELPTFVMLKVTDCEPGFKGDTVSGGSKPVTLESGGVLKVPLFINEGDYLKIDTRTMVYVSRASDPEVSS